jgi:hypothetical protein
VLAVLPLDSPVIVRNAEACRDRVSEILGCASDEIIVIKESMAP